MRYIDGGMLIHDYHPPLVYLRMFSLIYWRCLSQSPYEATSHQHRHQAILLAALAVSSITAKPTIQWKSCPQLTVASETLVNSSSENSSEDAECAIYDAPLCYPGVCTTPIDVDSTLEIFVKRFPATVGNPRTARNVWFLQGGPGISSASLESTTVDLQKKLGGSYSMYLMDHRGTGRSTQLSCSAFNSSIGVEAPDISRCAKELAATYGDMASFSQAQPRTSPVS